MSQPALIEPRLHTPSGYVSDACFFSDDGYQRLVFLHGHQAYCYDCGDRSHERQVWVQVYEAKIATYQQIADATGIARRSLQYWVQRFRTEGVGGLADRPRPGAPRKITDAMRRKISRLRAKRLSIRQIAQRCQISPTSVRRVLDEYREAADQAQQKLDLPAAPETPQLDAEPLCDQHPDHADESLATETTGETETVVIRDDRLEAAMAADRSEDRIAAAAGEPADAEPLFAPCPHLELAGAFLGIAALATDPFLTLGMEAYGRFKGAFYGIRTLLVMLVTMALLRIKNPEQLRRSNPLKLGRVLGLDRTPSARTLRRLLRRIQQAGIALTLMRSVAAARVRAQSGPVKVVLVDGHNRVYHGKEKIGEVHASRCNKVCKSQTDNWVHLPGGLPVLAVGSDFNQSLSQVLPEVVGQVWEVVEGPSLLCCFDRGGSCALTFEKLINANCHVLTYRKGPFEPVAESKFVRCETVIGTRTYQYAPYETTAVLPVYETVDRGPDKKPGRSNTGRTVELRDIRILREDGGQTSILASSPVKQLDALAAAETIFDRIGSQENTFKYMRAEFNLDGLACYGAEDLDAELTHPNPAYVKLEKKARKLRDKRNKVLAKYGEELAGVNDKAAVARLRAVSEALSTGDADAAVVKGRLTKNRRLRRDADKLAKWTRELDATVAEMASTPARENVSASGYKRLKSELSCFMNVVKMCAYHVETDLVTVLSRHYRRSSDEGRSVVAAALRSSGSLRLEPGRLVIRLEQQGDPGRTRAVNALCAELTARGVRFPGSARVLVFEPTVVPSAPSVLGCGK